MLARLELWWRIQWAIFVGLFPLTLFFFQQASLVTLLANFIAIPVVAILVVPLVLLGLIALFVNLPVIASGLLATASLVVDGLWPILHGLSDLPFSVWVSAAPEAWMMPVCAVAVVILLSPALGRGRLLGVFGFLPLFLTTSPDWEQGTFKIHVLDVGQGLAVLVETREHALLYDAGIKFPGGFDAGSSIVLPFMRQQHIGELNAVVASHDNLDHIGGLAAVLAAFPGARRYASAAFYAESEACEQGTDWQWDGVHFRFVHPGPGNRRSDNNDSCVLKIDSAYGSALLTGDIEKSSEQDLVDKAAPELDQTDLLLVPHHGSKTSSTRSFVDLVSPSLAIISAGYLNRFGHPHPKVRARYTGHNISLLNTASAGWIEVEFKPSGITATPWRSVYKRYWIGVSGEAIPGQLSLSRSSAIYVP